MVTSFERVGDLFEGKSNQLCVRKDEMKSKIEKTLESIKDCISDISAQSTGFKNRFNQTCQYPLEYQILTVNNLANLLVEIESNYELWLRYTSLHFNQQKGKRTKQPLQAGESGLEKVLELLERFDKVITVLKRRHENRPKLEVNDEYDIQDILYYLLVSIRDDVIREDPTPSFTSTHANADFILKDIYTIIETKMTKVSTKPRKLLDEILVDIPRYSKHKSSKTIIFFVYDKTQIIENPAIFKADLESESNSEHDIKVIVLR